MKNLVWFCFVIFLMLVHLPLASEGVAIVRLEPIDEAEEDSSFASFKKELKKALEKKDFKFLTKILSDEVQYSFGADPDRKNSVDGFLKHYKIKDSKGSDFGSYLIVTLDLGCTKSNEAFVCPYVYSKWPDAFDSFSFLAALKAKTPIRKKPEASAEVIKYVRFEILELAREQQKEGWRAVNLGKKAVGFVAQSDVRGATDYRAEFHKTLTGWKLVSFVSGD